MIQSILVGLDGSGYSDAAIELAIRWARQTGAALLGLGVIDEPTIRKPEPTGTGGGYYKARLEERRLKDAREKVTAFLERFKRRCSEAGVTGRPLAEVGLPSERIFAHAEDCDLTLLGLRTFFHFETQTEPDETLVAVLRQSRRPVVAIPEKLPERWSVVLAYDGSPPAVRALEAFQRSGLESWPAVRVVSVATDSEVATRRAEEAARYLGFHNIPAEARSLPASRPVAELLFEQVGELEAGVLVMGAFGRPWLRESLFGSTTKAVLEKVDALVFLHH
jgi:nucleotide-binding universal stress UspA family protein